MEVRTGVRGEEGAGGGRRGPKGNRRKELWTWSLMLTSSRSLPGSEGDVGHRRKGEGKGADVIKCRHSQVSF